MDERRAERAEQAAVAEGVLGVVRHDVRNKLSAIRNAVFYLQRKVEGTPLWSDDRRVPAFFALVEAQVLEAEELLKAQELLAGLYALEVGPVRLRTVVEEAVALARLDARPSLNVPEGLEVRADPAVLAAVLRMVLEDAPAGVSARAEGGAALVRLQGIRGDGERRRRALEAASGLGVARRLAERMGGQLTVTEDGAALELRMPLAA